MMKGMGMRLLAFIAVQALLLHEVKAAARRDPSITVDNNPQRDVVVYSSSSPTEARAYHPPLLAAPPAPAVARSVGNIEYQPPLLLAPSTDYKPLISSSQTQSVRYQAPDSGPHPQSIPLAYAQSQSSSQSHSAPLLASAQTGNPDNLPVQPGSRQGFAYSGDQIATNNQLNRQPAAPAESQQSSAASPVNDEYVVYYYYYYDNDTSANNTSNFDDIPSLESYDTDKSAKEPQKSASARTLAADVNSLQLSGQDHKRYQDTNVASQPRSASSSNSNQPPYIRTDKSLSHTDELNIQPLKPVSNVFRYGTNEVPKFPILPNFVVSEATPTTRPGGSFTSDIVPNIVPTTLPPGTAVGLRHNSPTIPNADQENDELNNVVDQPSNPKVEEENLIDETTTMTATEPPTTTEQPTTTTERSRRRPGTGGNRRRFNPSPSFSSSRRQPPSRTPSSSTGSTSTTTPTPSSSSTRSSFRGSNRVRPRPTISSNRPRPSFSRNVPSSNDNDETKTTLSSAPTTSPTTRPKFGSSSSSASRRFSSTRTRSQPTGTTRSTTTTTTSRPAPRPAPRPRPNLITSRARPPRPGLFRSRTPIEPEVPETTTATPEAPTEESSPAASNESFSPEENEAVGEGIDEETADVETEEPTTTEKNRFSALFRPRNRSTLNRPRPPIGRRTR